MQIEMDIPMPSAMEGKRCECGKPAQLLYVADEIYMCRPCWDERMAQAKADAAQMREDEEEKAERDRAAWLTENKRILQAMNEADDTDDIPLERLSPEARKIRLRIETLKAQRKIREEEFKKWKQERKEFWRKYGEDYP